MKNMLRILIAVLGLILIYLFIQPALRGIVNVGNMTGLIVGSLMIIGAIIFPKLVQISEAHKGVKAVLIGICCLVALIIVLTIATSSCIFLGASRQPDPSSVVIVLGCQVKGNQPSLMLGRRITAAAGYLKEHPDAKCIVSGGKGGGEEISEAECMKRGLIDLGIDPERIYLEDKSTTTVENIKFSKKILDEIAPDAPVAIVTNEFHQYRAGKICDSFGITDHGSVCSETSWWLWPTFHVREMYAVIYEWGRSAF